MYVYVFTCRNHRCRHVRAIPADELPDDFWRAGFRNPGYFDRLRCAACGADQPAVIVERSTTSAMGEDVCGASANAVEERQGA
jgi:hypothetical protein